MIQNQINTETLLLIPFHRLEINQNQILITKNRAVLNRKFFITIIIIGLISFLLYSLIQQSPNAFQKAIDVKGIIMLSAAAIYIVSIVILRFNRLLKVISNYTLTLDEGLYLNNKPIAQIINFNLVTVVIQNVGAAGKIGGSYTVGIAVGKRFYGLCFELDEEDAQKVASFLARNLNFSIETRDAAAFPILYGH